MKINQKKIPIKLRRIAARHLESIRETKIALNSEDLFLSESVIPIFRPDLKEPAYFEFQIIKETRNNIDSRNDLIERIGKINIYDPIIGLKEIYGTQDAIREIKSNYMVRFKSRVQGFIIVSTGTHDFPITHWSLESEAPSDLLKRLANEHRNDLYKIFKVDSLSYVGEDKNGKEVGSLGQKPSLISGLPDNLLSHMGKISSAELERKATRNENDSVKIRQGRLIQRGPKPKKFKFMSTKWDMLKKNFENSFKPLINQLKISASKVWEKEKIIEEFGEGILAGSRFFVPLLDNSPLSFSLKNDLA